MALSNQDLFVKLLLPNIKGYYVDIGAGNGNGAPCDSNTSYLEEHNWTGILIDLDEYLINEAARLYRKNSICIRADALNLNYKQLFDEFKVPKVIDYLTIDIDPLANIQDPNVQVLKIFPFNDYDFKILTIEHDLYNPHGPYQKKSLEDFMQNKDKYKLIAQDVGLVYDSKKYLENWYINKDFFNDFNIKDIENLFYYRIHPNDLILDLVKRIK